MWYIDEQQAIKYTDNARYAQSRRERSRQDRDNVQCQYELYPDTEIPWLSYKPWIYCNMIQEKPQRDPKTSDI